MKAMAIRRTARVTHRSRLQMPSLPTVWEITAGAAVLLLAAVALVLVFVALILGAADGRGW